jgi:hypothetical protein
MRMRQTKRKAKARQRIDASCTLPPPPPRRPLLLCGDKTLAMCRAGREREREKFIDNQIDD